VLGIPGGTLGLGEGLGLILGVAEGILFAYIFINC
jgi:hypothetical protein